MEYEKKPLESDFQPVFVQPNEPVTVLHITDEQQAGIIQKPKWRWCNFGTSVFAVLCCCCSPCGLVGLAYSMLAYVDHKSRDFARIPQKKSCSWGWTITAIILGSLFWISLIVGVSLYIELIYEYINTYKSGRGDLEGQWNKPEWNDEVYPTSFPTSEEDQFIFN